MQVKIINIEGSLLQSFYTVYLIQIENTKENDVYYYVGQTGNAKIITARSPLYRIGGHLLPYSKSS